MQFITDTEKVNFAMTYLIRVVQDWFEHSYTGQSVDKN